MPMADLCFFTPSRPLSVAQAAEFVGATLRQSALGSRNIVALSALDQSHSGALTFIHDKKHDNLLPHLVAAAILCSQEWVTKIPDDVAVLVSAHPQRDFSAIGRLLFPQSVQPASILGESGISPLAYIHPEADLEEGVTVEAGAVIGRGVEIGTGTLVGAGTVIGANCKIGRHAIISAHVSLQYALIGDRVHLHPGVRVGQDGFGYVSGERGIEKVPQLGRVVIQDDVEIGANSTVDRGALRDTLIGEGTKIDNMVQIAHNVRIGRYCLIAAHCGFSGSVTIGDMTRIGGDVGVADHIKIGSHVQIAAASGVMNNIPDGEKWGGSPARPFKQWFREVATLRSISRGGKEKE